MEQQHKIEESVFDFHFDSEDVAFDQHLAIETLVKQRLLPVIDEVFTDMSASATVHRIETLEIDLGPVRTHEMQDELPRRLRERLRSLLQERLLGEPLEDAAPVQPLDPTALAWEQLQAFLRSGYLPWQATPGHDQIIEQLFHHVLQADPARLLAFLQHAPQRATVLQRLVRQLPPVSLADLVRTLAPGQARLVHGVLEVVPQLWEGQPETWTRPTAFQALLWEQVLEMLLSTPGDVLAPHELTRRILSGVLRHQGRAEVQTLSRLTQAVTQRLLEAAAVLEEGQQPRQHAETEPRPPEASFQPSTFPGEGAGLEATTGAGVSDALAASRAALPMALPERLVDALVRGDMALLQESWPALLRQYPVLLRQLLHHHARQAARRRSLVRRLPEAMLRDVLGLLAPEGQRAIMALLAQPEALQQVIRTATRHDLHRRLWEYTLAYLLVQPRTGFQVTTYLDSLAQQLALQAQVGYHDVLRALAHGLQQRPTTAGPEPALEQALHTLLRERYDRTPLGRETPDSASRALLQAYALYDRLVRRVRAGSSDVSNSVESLIPVIDRLAQAHPSLLLRLYRAMQSGELAVTTLINALTAPELERLLQVLVPLLHLPGGDEPASVLMTIAQQAAQASDTRAYYGTVLRALVEELPLAVATARAREAAETASPAWRFQAVGHALAVAAAAAQLETAAMPLTDERYEHLRQHLRQEPESSTLPGSDLTPVIAVLAQEQPALLLQLYWECQTGALPLATMVRVLTPPELAGLLRAWLGLPALGGTSATAEVLQRITAAAAQATAARDYYGAVLRALMEERPLDVRTLLDPTPALQSETPRGLSGAAEAERPAEESPGEGLVPGAVSEANVSPEAIEAQEAPDETVSWRVYEATEAVRETVGRPAQALSPGTSGSPSAAMLRAYEHYARVWQRLVQDREAPDAPVSDLVPLIEALAQEQPGLLLRLYLELQTGAVALTTLTSRLSVTEGAALLRALVRLVRGADSSVAADLLSVIDRATAEGQALQQLYLQVFQALLRDQGHEVEALPADQQPAVLHQETVLQEPLADRGEPDTTSAPVDIAPVLADDDEARLLHYMRAEATVPPAELPRLRQTFEWLLARQPARLRWVLEPLLERPQTATRLITLLPEWLLTRLLFLLRPAEHYALQSFADALALACYGRGVPLTPARIQQVKWQFLLQYACSEGLPFQQETFVQRLADALAHDAQAPDTLAFRDLLSQQLARAALPQPQYQALLAALRPAGAAIQETTSVAAAESLPADTAEPTENIYITNAGQVLAAPYLPRLFAILGLVEGPAFHDQQAAERAVHLLQFMVNESTTSPEYQLVLNKLLCGVRTGVPIVREIVITEQEKDTIESLIRGMIQHWKIIGNTSVAGLREAFLQREGRLQLRDNAWHLLVEPRAFDMLLDQLPWSIATIKLPWMEHVLYVEWR